MLDILIYDDDDDDDDDSLCCLCLVLEKNLVMHKFQINKILLQKIYFI